MQLLNIFHVLIAIALIAFVLIQRGQGATAGAAFGSGASGTVFGARGAGNFLSRSTWVLAVLFCAISLTMAVLVSHMMVAPEADLGVVTAIEQTGGQSGESAGDGAAPQLMDSSGGGELNPVDDGQAPIDMPSLAPAADDLPSGETMAAPAVGEGAESVSADDLPASGGENEDTSPAADGN